MINDELIHKWVNNQLTATELETFKLRPEYDELVELFKATENLETPSFDEQKMLSNILSQVKVNNDTSTETIERTLEQPTRRNFLLGWIKYVAAAVLIFGMAMFFWPENSNNYMVEVFKGEPNREMVLPDGSTILLNAESRLFYDGDNWGAKREVTLFDGEAFFKVKKGTTFTVQTNKGVVKVLGTEFNIKDRNELVEVHCQSGKVEVIPENKTAGEILTKDEGVKIVNGNLTEKYEATSDEKISWIKGISKLRKVPLSRVLEEIERQFGVEITADKIDTNQIVSCNFEHKDLEMALKTGLSSLGIGYQVLEKDVILHNE